MPVLSNPKVWPMAVLLFATVRTHAQNFYGEYAMDKRGGDRSYYAYLTPDTFLFEAKDYWKKSTKTRAFVFYPTDSAKHMQIDSAEYMLSTQLKDTDKCVIAVNASDTLRLYQISCYTRSGVGRWYDDVLATTKATGRPRVFRQYVMDTLADREWPLSATGFRYDERRRTLYRQGLQQLYFSQTEQQQILDAYADRGRYPKYALVVKEKRWWKKGKLVKTKTYSPESFFPLPRQSAKRLD